MQGRARIYNPEWQGGWVYFIRCTGTNLVKIGHTDTRPLQRLRTLQTGAPATLRMVGVIEGGRETERELHRRFASSRERGEWFRQTPELFVFLLQNVLLVPELLDVGGLHRAHEMKATLQEFGVSDEQWIQDIQDGRFPVPRSYGAETDDDDKDDNPTPEPPTPSPA